MKTCPQCGVEKQDEGFGRSNQTKDGLRGWCKECDRKSGRERYAADPEAREKAKAAQAARYADPEKRKLQLAASRRWQERNVEKVKEITRNSRLKIEYGIRQADYERMIVEQGGRCALCRKATKLQVDHDHETGEVRGLLCGPCNRALGLLGDNREGVAKALRYLGGQVADAPEPFAVIFA